MGVTLNMTLSPRHPEATATNMFTQLDFGMYSVYSVQILAGVIVIPTHILLSRRKVP
jgi:hypothetical protein